MNYALFRKQTTANRKKEENNMDSAIKEEKRYVGVKEIIAYGAASGGGFVNKSV